MRAIPTVLLLLTLAACTSDNSAFDPDAAAPVTDGPAPQVDAADLEFLPPPDATTQPADMAAQVDLAPSVDSAQPDLLCECTGKDGAGFCRCPDGHGGGPYCCWPVAGLVCRCR